MNSGFTGQQCFKIDILLSKSIFYFQNRYYYSDRKKVVEENVVFCIMK